jgi:predicted P-loop ATPase
LKNLLISDFSTIYNPFEEYLFNLPKWDGKTDHIENLAYTVHTTNNTFWKKAFKKWMVSVVGSLIKEDILNHQMIVLSGRQGIGKTTWIKRLLPKDLSKYFFSGSINPNDKDTMIYLSECVLIDLDELENLQRKEVGSLKTVLTKTQIKVRRPYDVFPTDYPRRASFIGSINGKDFLNDYTGSRRYLCFDVSRFDLDHDVNIDLVYSQALSLFRSGFKHWFEGKDIEEIEENNRQFEIRSVEEEQLLELFEPVDIGNADIFLNASSVAKHINDYTGKAFRLNHIKMGKALTKLGFEATKRNNGTKVYALKQIIRHN